MHGVLAKTSDNLAIIVDMGWYAVSHQGNFYQSNWLLGLMLQALGAMHLI